jgi:hypothetical protein
MRTGAGWCFSYASSRPVLAGHAIRTANRLLHFVGGWGLWWWRGVKFYKKNCILLHRFAAQLVLSINYNPFINKPLYFNWRLPEMFQTFLRVFEPASPPPRPLNTIPSDALYRFSFRTPLPVRGLFQNVCNTAYCCSPALSALHEQKLLRYAQNPCGGSHTSSCSLTFRDVECKHLTVNCKGVLYGCENCVWY